MLGPQQVGKSSNVNCYLLMSPPHRSTVPSCQVCGLHDASQEADQQRWWESGGSQKEQERGSSGVARGST